MSKLLKILSTAASASLLLCACSGGGGGDRVETFPPPAPSPPPPPPPPPPPAPPYEARVARIFGEPLYNADLAVTGKGWKHEYIPNVPGARDVRDADSFGAVYDPASKSYKVTLPDGSGGTLMQTGEYGTFPFNPGFLADPTSKQPTEYCCATLAMSAADRPTSKYRYVSFADFFAQTPGAPNPGTLTYGTFGIAQPTRAGEVPTTGTARYSGDLFGHFAGDAGATWIDGTARFDFDFAAAKLSGDLTVSMQCMMGCMYDKVVYTLTNTAFVRGSTSFSGSLTTTGAPSQGSFAGLFAGPGATEMMSGFQLPFFNPEYRQWMSAGGVILGKRD